MDMELYTKGDEGRTASVEESVVSLMHVRMSTHGDGSSSH